MTNPVGQVIVRVWVAAGIALFGVTAGANPLSTSKANSEFIVGTIVPAERAMALQPAAPDVKFDHMRASQATLPTQRANEGSADGTSQAADAAANQAATLGPRGCSGCLRSAETQAVTQAADRAANEATALGPVCGTCVRAPPLQAATQAANQSANQAATLGPRGCTGCLYNAATEAANRSANQAATLGPRGPTW